MDKKQMILQMLRDADDYVSGQQIGDRLGVSRTAAWKLVGKLKEEGYPIEAVTKKGYRLLSVDDKDIFNEKEIANQMRTVWAGHPLLFKEVTGSTNADAFQASEEGFPHGTLIVTSQQTAGRGRRGREWISPPDENIYMSILLRPALRPEAAPMLTLVQALAVCEAAQEICGGRVQFAIKWPNDLVVRVGGGAYRKCCGILTEMRLEENEIRDVVIGIGINVNQTEFPDTIRETATSIALAMAEDGAAFRRINRAALTAGIWEKFEIYYDRFEKAQSLAPLREAYEARLVNTGRAVRVLDPAGPFDGVAAGITDYGDLVVRPADGSPDRHVSSGEVSVRGVNGYV